MRNITNKINTHRKARAQAVVKASRPETIKAIENREVPKGDVFEISRTAGLMGVKRTSDNIPHCHPIPVEHTDIQFEIQDQSVLITLEAQTIYKTGIEVEAMHGVTMTALTLYDVLKPIDPEVQITDIKVLDKKGGKNQFTDKYRTDLKAAVVVCSDSISAGKKKDKAGKVIQEKLRASKVEIVDYEVIPDEPEQIRTLVQEYCDDHLDLVLITGGTGLSLRDKTPEALEPLIDTPVPGIMEAARNYGQQRTPYAMLSRGIAGLNNNTLILTLPGSTNGARESMDALFPYLLHSFRILAGRRHE